MCDFPAGSECAATKEDVPLAQLLCSAIFPIDKRSELTTVDQSEDGMAPIAKGPISKR